MDEEEKQKKKCADDGLKCPRCGSGNIYRILDDISRMKEAQVFKCGSCDKKFYKRHVEDYSPTY